MLGSLSSDLGIEVAAVAEEHGLVHLEVGALSDRAVGRRSLRATGGASDTAAVVCRTLRGRDYRVVSESSPFASAIADALRALDPRTGLAVPIGEAGADFAAFWDAGNASDVLVAIARPPLPERLCEAIGHSGLRGVELVGLGSWGREAVDKVARDAGVHLRFVDVLPASLLVPDALTAPVRESLLAYLPTRRTVYGDLGWAAGLLLGRPWSAVPLRTRRSPNSVSTARRSASATVSPSTLWGTTYRRERRSSPGSEARS